MSYNSQADQDKFVLHANSFKRNGYFLEISSNDPIKINNTYILESSYDWKGIMVEYQKAFLPFYQKFRGNSIHLIDDATKIDYLSVLEKNNFPKDMDYLQIDLEVHNKSTINALELLNDTIRARFI